MVIHHSATLLCYVSFQWRIRSYILLVSILDKEYVLYSRYSGLTKFVCFLCRLWTSLSETGAVSRLSISRFRRSVQRIKCVAMGGLCSALRRVKCDHYKKCNWSGRQYRKKVTQYKFEVWIQQPGELSFSQNFIRNVNKPNIILSGTEIEIEIL